jgi:hypothetical protein
VDAIVAESPQEASVSVNWQNSSDNETQFLVQRSIDGGAFSTIGSVGADTTSYTDTSVPLNADGDADVAYQVLAADDAGQSGPSPQAGADVQATSIKEIDVFVNLKAKIHSGQAANGFQFPDRVHVTGTNLQNVRFIQYLSSTATALDATGQPMDNPGDVLSPPKLPDAEPLANSPNWERDGGYFNGVWVPMTGWNIGASRYSTLNQAGADGVAMYDLHDWKIPYSGSVAGEYTNLSTKTGDFLDIFTYPTLDPKNPGKEITITRKYPWSYAWSNSGAKLVPPRQELAPWNLPADFVVASPSVGGAPFLTGTNIAGISGVPIVDDITKIKG